MARFVSPHRNLTVGVRAFKESKLGPDGVMQPEVSELNAEFTPDLRTDEDIAVALSTFVFRGMPIYENGQEVRPHYRISVFDTDVAALQQGWTDEDKALVEYALRDKAGQTHVEVIPVAADKPWNRYDEMTDADRIVELAVDFGADLTKVLQYEVENQNRADVKEALTAALNAADETIIVSA